MNFRSKFKCIIFPQQTFMENAVLFSQGCKNMLTFLTPESPNFQSFLVLPGVLNENPEDLILNYIIYRILKHKCLKYIEETSMFYQSIAQLNK